MSDVSMIDTPAAPVPEKKLPKSLPPKKKAKSKKKEEVRRAWNEGQNMTLHGVRYKGKFYSSLWQVWGKKGEDGCEAGLNLGSRGQCIKYRAQLKKLKDKCPPFRDRNGKLHSFTLCTLDGEPIAPRKKKDKKAPVEQAPAAE